MTKRMKNLPPDLLATVLALFLSAVNCTAQGLDVPITYHGGSTLTSPINIYLIWYGQWPDKFLNNRQLVLERFLADSASSRYAHTNDAYFGNPSLPVYTLAGTAVDHYSQGAATLTESTIYNIVRENAAFNSWPLEVGWNSPSPVFFVISSSDLRATLQLSGSLSEFNVYHAPGDPIQGMCAWHGSVLIFQRDGNPSFSQETPNVRFGLVGDPGDGGICRAQFNPPDPRFTAINSQVAPNNASGDAMINHLVHEILEAANDPDDDAWYGPHHHESADACAFNFGSQTPFPTGGPNNGSYNLQINGSYYFVQQQWVNWGNGYCGMLYQPSEPTPLYPYNGLLHVGSAFPVRWKSGLDGASPVDPAHSVNYTIESKYWPYGGTEPAVFTKTDMPQCNMDSAGICNTTEINMLDGTYRWRVDANLYTGQSSPAVVTISSIATFTVGYQPIGTIPPPLPPGPFYPYDGLQGVSSNFPVQWRDGLDTERRNSGLWPVTYAIYYKYWPFGGVEPQNYTLVVANQPCNPVSLGICGTYVSGEPAGNFRWYVIANMDASLFTGVPNSILSTQSSVATFTVGP